MRTQLTLADVRDLEHADLIERLDALLAPYDKPQVESQTERMTRIGRTLDEMPEVYRFLLQLWSWADHWTDSMAEMFGRKDDNRYKRMRQRRDLLEKMASSAKMRYEGASRQITVLEGFDPTGMPRQRRAT